MKRLLTLIVLAAAAVATAASSASAAFPGGNGKIVFTGAGNPANRDIYSIDPDGTNRTNLTNDGEVDDEAAVSADGKKIAWTRTQANQADVWTMDADGSNKTKLTAAWPGSHEPTWSPDGRIAFIRDGDIWVMKADGSAQTQLTTGGHDESPAWSPDGRTIAFVSNRGQYNGIWLMDAAGTNLRQLTFTYPGADRDPSWSPDGSQLVFTTTRTGGGEIWTVSVPGGGQRQLVSIAGGNGANPSFSPDGKKIVFNWDGGLVTVNADGSDRGRLTPPRTVDPTAVDAAADWGVAPPSPPADTAPPTVSCNAPGTGQWYGTDVAVACTATDGGSGLADQADASFSLTTSVAAGSQDANAQTGTRQVCDVAGNCAPAGPFGGYKVDRKAPDASCTALEPDTGQWYRFNVDATCTASDDGSGLGDDADLAFLLTTAVPAGSENANASTGTRTVCDAVGNCATAGPLVGYKIDRKAPETWCPFPSPDTWWASNVEIYCTAVDSGSGLANPADPSFKLTTNVPAGTETATATTDSRQVCDAVGNCTTAGPIAGIKIDRKPPTLVLPATIVVDATSPSGAVVTFTVSATDADPSPSVTCGPGSGATFPIGTTTVSCAATDQAGNGASGTFTVEVRGAVEQALDLSAEVAAFVLGAGNPLLGPVRTVIYWASTSGVLAPRSMCGPLAQFIAGVQVAKSLRVLPPATAADWIADATRIRAVLACP